MPTILLTKKIFQEVRAVYATTLITKLLLAFSRAVSASELASFTPTNTIFAHAMVSATPPVLQSHLVLLPPYFAQQYTAQSDPVTSPSGSNSNSPVLPDPVPPSALTTPPVEFNTASICQNISSIKKCQSFEALLLARLDPVGGDAARSVCAELIIACQQKLAFLTALNKELK